MERVKEIAILALCFAKQPEAIENYSPGEDRKAGEDHHNALSNRARIDDLIEDALRGERRLEQEHRRLACVSY